jgi:hypothetical protein
MLVVAGVALVCTAIAELPGGVYRLIPLIPVIGPLIGAGWAGRRYQPGSLDPISGALVGGAVQAMLMAMVLSVVLPNSPEFLFLPLLAVQFVYGFVVGLIATYALLALSSSEPPSSRTITGRRRGTGLRDLEPARAVDELEAWSELCHEGPQVETLVSTSEATAVEARSPEHADDGAGPDKQDQQPDSIVQVRSPASHFPPGEARSPSEPSTSLKTVYAFTGRS